MTSTTPDDATPAGGMFDATRPTQTRDGCIVHDLRKVPALNGKFVLQGRVGMEAGERNWALDGRYSLEHESQDDLVNVAPALPTAERETGESGFDEARLKLICADIVDIVGANGDAKHVHDSIFIMVGAFVRSAIARHGAAAAGGAVGDVDLFQRLLMAIDKARFTPDGIAYTPLSERPYDIDYAARLAKGALAAIPATPTGATQPSPAAGGGEAPVAWQWHIKNAPWFNVLSEQEAKNHAEMYRDGEWRALYAHPAPHAGEAVGRRDGMLRAAEIAEDMAGSIESPNVIADAIRAEADRPTDTHDARGTSAEREGAETDGELLQRIGTDAAKWAVEFRTKASRLGYSEMDEGWLIGWFANAIEAGRDAARAHANPLADVLAEVSDGYVWQDKGGCWWDAETASIADKLRIGRPIRAICTHGSAEREGAGRDDAGVAVGVSGDVAFVERVARTALERIRDEPGGEHLIACDALDAMFPLERKQPLQGLVGHGRNVR